MNQLNPNISTREESDLMRVVYLFTRHYKVYAICVLIAIALAFLFNRYAVPIYSVSSSLMILEDQNNQGRDMNDYINSELFGMNQGFQNELYVLKSTPVIEQTVKNLDLTVNYFTKEGFRFVDAYKSTPIHVMTLKNHVQPVNIKFTIAIHDKKNFTIRANDKNVSFTNLYTSQNSYQKGEWSIDQKAKFGTLIETPDMALVVQLDSSVRTFIKDDFIYAFELTSVSRTTGRLKGSLEFSVVDRDATVIEISYSSTSRQKGVDILNELMDVYSTQNVNRKNHIANVTIEYIERQLGEISDSLSQTEDNLQQFRSSRQLLDVTDQATGISAQYMDLQNQMAELVTKKRYYDYLADHMANNKDFSNIIAPTAMGIQDELLNGMVSQLINAQAQLNNLIRNRQERNPLVQRLQIQIENGKKNISDNISAVRKTTDIAIDEMNKRLNQVKGEISRMPKTQRQLGGIERNYRLNDAIYNYLLEKRAEAKISQASNLPDNVIIEPGNMTGIAFPNPQQNYIFAFALGIMLPFAFLFLKSMISEKIEYQGKINNLTDAPLLGKIPYTRKKINNYVFEFPRSRMAEAYRALRTNLEYRFRDLPRKVMMVSSSIEGEGKSFTALNLAMCYAQLGKKTLLIDFDLRKPTGYFSDKEISPIGLTSYFNDKINISEIVQHSPHPKLDYVPSGPIPPSPVELLASEDIRDILEHFKESYDCIVLDTTPLAQVADAYLLFDYADIKIMVARYNYTLKRVFHMIMSDLKEKKIENVCVVLNGNKIYQDQYGYGYGYERKKARFFRKSI